MPLGSIICRKNLDEERRNPWICECPLCKEARKKEIEAIVNPQIWGWERSYLRTPTLLRRLNFEPSYQSLSTASTLLQLLSVYFPFLQVAFELTRVSWFLPPFIINLIIGPLRFEVKRSLSSDHHMEAES